MFTQAEIVPTLTYTEATEGDVDLSMSQASVTVGSTMNLVLMVVELSSST